MSEFKRGCYIKVLDSSKIKGGECLADGFIYEVINVEQNGDLAILDNNDETLAVCTYEFDYIELVRGKMKWKHRVAALEKEMEGYKKALNELYAIVNKAPEETSADRRTLMGGITENVQLTYITDDAKLFIKNHGASNIEYVVNEEYRAVTAIFYKGDKVLTVYHKFNEAQVFNADIGKAIVLAITIGLNDIAAYYIKVSYRKEQTL